MSVAADRVGGCLRRARRRAPASCCWTATVFAQEDEAAEKLAARGGVALEPCHHHGAVGPMAGIISPSMPVWIVKNRVGGAQAYSNLNEGLGKVLRFGANEPAVIERLCRKVRHQARQEPQEGVLRQLCNAA